MAAKTTIQLGNLAEPVLTEGQRRLVEEAERHPVELTEEAVLSAAVERVGLDDFGPDDFRGRLRLILDELGSDENATELNKASVWSRSVRQAATRLLVVDLLRRHPEIHEEPVDAPIVVGGLPRSGTTHMLNLVAADGRLHDLPYWEALEPLPLPGEREGPAGADPRWLRAQAAWEAALVNNPYIVYHHPMDPDHVSEDGELQLPDFASYTMEFAYLARRWREHYLSHDQTPHYEFQKTMMKILQWRRGERKRWVVKAPQHIEQLQAIVNVWPDATIVITHRDPIASLESTLTMHGYRNRTSRRRPSLQEVVDYWVPRYPIFLERYLEQRDAVPGGQLVDVRFDEFVRDNMGTVEHVYDVAGLTLTEEARAEIEAWAEENRQHRLGSIDHDLPRDFGLDPAELRRRYDFYLERVPLAVEVV